jgi:hypothetical protein
VALQRLQHGGMFVDHRLDVRGARLFVQQREASGEV